MQISELMATIQFLRVAILRSKKRLNQTQMMYNNSFVNYEYLREQEEMSNNIIDWAKDLIKLKTEALNEY